MNESAWFWVWEAHFKEDYYGNSIEGEWEKIISADCLWIKFSDTAFL